jgi:hypothetical protein
MVSLNKRQRHQIGSLFQGYGLKDSVLPSALIRKALSSSDVSYPMKEHPGPSLRQSGSPAHWLAPPVLPGHAPDIAPAQPRLGVAC